MVSKVLSVRLNESDQERLHALANELDLGPSILARMLLHSSIAHLEELKALRQIGRFPLSLLSELLAPAALSKGLTDGDLQRSVKMARKKIMTERYSNR